MVDPDVIVWFVYAWIAAVAVSSGIVALAVSMLAPVYASRSASVANATVTPTRSATEQAHRQTGPAPLHGRAQQRQVGRAERVFAIGSDLPVVDQSLHRFPVAVGGQVVTVQSLIHRTGGRSCRPASTSGGAGATPTHRGDGVARRACPALHPVTCPHRPTRRTGVEPAGPVVRLGGERRCRHRGTAGRVGVTSGEVKRAAGDGPCDLSVGVVGDQLVRRVGLRAVHVPARHHPG